jgi:hypothetical protein
VINKEFFTEAAGFAHGELLFLAPASEQGGLFIVTLLVVIVALGGLDHTKGAQVKDKAHAGKDERGS